MQHQPGPLPFQGPNQLLQPTTMTSSPASAGTHPERSRDDKPRIFVDGPGGADTKQGAKIACLECRSAKIKCSAPTDGQVPCKRCVKHNKECLFEKHKRGRKPNKRFSLPDNIRVDSAAQEPLSEGSNGKVAPASQKASGNGSDEAARDASNNSSQAFGRAQSRPTGSTGTIQPHFARETGREPFHGPDTTHRYHGTSPGGSHQRQSDVPPSANSWQQQQHLQRPHHRSDEDSHRYSHQVDRGDRHYTQHTNGSYSSSSHGGSLSSSASAPSGLNQGPPFAPYLSNAASSSSIPTERGTTLAAPPPPPPGGHSAYPSRRGPVEAGSPGRWADYASGQVPSPGSSGAQTGLQSYGSIRSPGRSDGPGLTYSQSRNRTYAVPSSGPAPAPSHNYSQWDSRLGLDRTVRSRPDGAPRPTYIESQSDHAGSSVRLPHEDGNTQSNAAGDPESGIKSAGSPSSPGKANSTAHGRGRAHSGPWNAKDASGSQHGHDADEELDDEQDELEDDADATKDEHDNVLSNPLKLLAQASDAAAAVRVEGGRAGRLDSGSRSSLAAVETMGLLHTTPTSSRMAVSAAVNLTGLGRSFGRPRPDEAAHPRGWAASRTLPPLGQGRPPLSEAKGSTRDSYFDRAHDRSQRFQPSFLASSMRSKSYPAGGLQVSDHGSPADEASESRSTQGLLPSDREALFGRSNTLAPSTLDHDAWEYREGKAQTRRGYGTSDGAGASPGTLSQEGLTVASSQSGSREGAASPINASLSPSDDPKAMLGKRKRSRSRLSKTISARRRRVNGWDTDGDANLDSVIEKSLDAAEPRREKVVSIVTDPAKPDSGGITSGGEGEAGASRKGYFNLSMFHSKYDVHEGIDPVELGLVEIKEVEKLFDIFFARINPILDLFDPFLHSVSYVRRRSAFLTTVISGLAARLSDTARDAEIATVLDKHWQEKLLPMILLEGYKSVEISQAFLLLTTYCRPTNRLVDDRSWQYLGFSIRTATEIGVNRKVTLRDNVIGYEQICRRIRNRERLWFNLFLYDRTLSAQTGRPWTISEDRMIIQSSMWHRQDFALPEDVSLVSLIKLRRITGQHTEAFATFLSSPDRLDGSQTRLALRPGEQSQFDRRLAGLEFFLKNANSDLERWKETWCINTEEKIKEVDTSTAAGKYLVRWAPTAKLFYYHSRLLINALVLEATEQYEEFIAGSTVSVDCWTAGISLIDTALNEFTEESLVAWSNDRVVMAVYAAISALRLTNLDKRYPFADKETGIALVLKLIARMIQAGKTPKHRNGSATAYGRYLRSVLTLFEPQSQVVSGQSPEKDSEQATTVSTSSLAPCDSRSAAATPGVPADSNGTTSATTVDNAGAATTSSPPKSGAGATQAEAVVASNAPDASVQDVKMVTVADTAADAAESAGGDATAQADLQGANAAAVDTGTAHLESAIVAAAGGVGCAPIKMEEASNGGSCAAAAGMVGLNGLADGLGAPSLAAAAAAAAGVAPIGVTGMGEAEAMEAWAATATDLASNGVVTAGGVLGGGAVPALGVLNASDPVTVAAAAAAAAATATATATSGGSGGGATSRVVNAVAGGGTLAGELGGNAAGGEGNVDDPESIERLWDYMTTFEPNHFSGAFWQPQTTWNTPHGGQ